MEIGERIRMLRQTGGMTQEAFSEKMGVSVQTISRWENGRTYPDVTAVPQIAACFGVTADYLLGMEVSRPSARLLETMELFETTTRLEAEDLLKRFSEESFPKVREACIREEDGHYLLKVVKEFGAPFDDMHFGRGKR